MKRAWLALLIAPLMMAQADKPAVARPDLALWRLDCGTLENADFAAFSDTGRYDGQKRTLVVSCYLIKHGEDYLLWDAGLDGKLEGKPRRDAWGTLRLDRRIVPQLARIGVTPAQVKFVGISHYHDDHTGQANDFPGATLLIGAGDWAVSKSAEGERRSPGQFAPWKAGGKVDAVEGDKDVFGDGSVTMLALPGHTPGHHGLLVKLPKTGSVLLSGDQFHSSESLKYSQVPSFNTDRADTLASIARFNEIAVTMRATVIIQHEPADIAKLSAFPEAAR